MEMGKRTEKKKQQCTPANKRKARGRLLQDEQERRWWKEVTWSLSSWLLTNEYTTNSNAYMACASGQVLYSCHFWSIRLFKTECPLTSLRVRDKKAHRERDIDTLRWFVHLLDFFEIETSWMKHQLSRPSVVVQFFFAHALAMFTHNSDCGGVKKPLEPYSSFQQARGQGLLFFLCTAKLYWNLIQVGV